jgi:hypothetical protein
VSAFHGLPCLNPEIQIYHIFAACQSADYPGRKLRTGLIIGEDDN